jgi:hypothetical protein
MTAGVAVTHHAPSHVIEDVEAVVRKWYHLENLEPIHVALAVVVANQMPGDPLWAFLVGPPSSLKTEIIRALGGIPSIFPLSNLTANTFASGYQSKNDEPSLLMKLDGKILTLKDFTTILTMHHDKRAEILAQLREIYDGSYKKSYGNGKVVDWAGKIGLLAGVTPIIDTHYSVSQVLGERFLLYRLLAQDELVVAGRAMNQRGDERQMRAEVRDTITQCVRGLRQEPVQIPDPILARLGALAAFTARARSSCVWDHRGELISVPEPEGPGRLAKQFCALAQGLAVVRGTPSVTDEDYLTVCHVAQDTVPANHRALIDELVRRVGAAEPSSTTELGEAVRFSTSMARRNLQELVAMDLARRIRAEKQGLADRFELSERATKLLRIALPEAPQEGG